MAMEREREGEGGTAAAGGRPHDDHLAIGRAGPLSVEQDDEGENYPLRVVGLPLPEDQGQEQNQDGFSATGDDAQETLSQVNATSPSDNQSSDAVATAAATGEESGDVTYSQIDTSGPAPETPVKRKRGRPRKQVTLETAAASPSSLPPPSPSGSEFDAPTSAVRTSARAHRRPAHFDPADGSSPRRSSFSGRAGTGRSRVSDFTSEEDLQLQEDIRQREAGVARVYMNPPGSSRAENSNKKVLGRPRISSIAVFKSDKLKDPEYLTKNIGSWTEAHVAIQTEKLLEAEAAKQARADAKAAAKLAAGEVKPKRVYHRKPKNPAPPNAPLTPTSQQGAEAGIPVDLQGLQGPPPMNSDVASTTEASTTTPQPNTHLENAWFTDPQLQTPQQSSLMLPGATPAFTQVYQRLYGNALFGQPREYRSPFARRIDDVPSSTEVPQLNANPTCANPNVLLSDCQSKSLEQIASPAPVDIDSKAGAHENVAVLLEPAPPCDAIISTAIQEAADIISAALEPSVPNEVAELPQAVPTPEASSEAPNPNIEIPAVIPVVVPEIVQDTSPDEPTTVQPSPPPDDVGAATPSTSDSNTRPQGLVDDINSHGESQPGSTVPGSIEQQNNQGSMLGTDTTAALSTPIEDLAPKSTRLATEASRTSPAVEPDSNMEISDSGNTIAGLPLEDSSLQVVAPVRRGRGRPRKNPLVAPPAPKTPVTVEKRRRGRQTKSSMNLVPDEPTEPDSSIRRQSIASSAKSGRVTRSKVSPSPALDHAVSMIDTEQVASSPIASWRAASSKAQRRSSTPLLQVENGRDVTPATAGEPLEQVQNQIDIRKDHVGEETVNNGFESITTEERLTEPDFPSTSVSNQHEIFRKPSLPTYQSAFFTQFGFNPEPQQYKSPFAKPSPPPQPLGHVTPVVSYQSPYQSPYALSSPSSQPQPQPEQPAPVARSDPFGVTNTSTSESPRLHPSAPETSTASSALPYNLPSFLGGNAPKPYSSLYAPVAASPTPYKSPYASSAGPSFPEATAASPVSTEPRINGAGPPTMQMPGPAQPLKKGTNYPKAKRGRPRKTQRPVTPQAHDEPAPIAPIHTPSLNGIDQQCTPEQVAQTYFSYHDPPSMSLGLPDFVKPVSSQPPINPGDFFDEEHEYAVRSMTPQTPMSQPRPVSSHLSLTDQTPIITDTSTRRKSSLNVRAKQRKLSIAQPGPQPDIDMSGNVGFSTDMSMLPPPINPESQQHDLETDLLAADSVELTNVAFRLSSVFKSVVGSLVLSEDKSQLRFVELHQEDITPDPWTLSTVDMSENPITSETRSKRTQLVLYTKPKNARVIYKFVIASTPTAQDAAANMRKELIKAKLTADVQRKLKENILDQAKLTGPVQVVKPYKCDTCDGAWLNREGVKYHKEHSKTTCNPNWVPPAPTEERRVKKRKLQHETASEAENAFLQLRQQAPLVLPNHETGAWDQTILSGPVLRRNARKRQKRVIEDLVDFDLSEDEIEEETQTWTQAPMLLPNPLTGAWDQVPEKPKKPQRRGGSKKGKKAAKAKSKVQETNLDMVVDDEDSGYEEWLEQQLASKKRRRHSSSSEDEDAFMPDFEERDDVLRDEIISGSDMDIDLVSMEMDSSSRYHEVFPNNRNNNARGNKGKKGRRGKKNLPRKSASDILGSTQKPRYKWVDPRVKNPMTEEEKAAKRERAILRQQTWKKPITSLPNHQTGAWDQQPFVPVPPPRRGYSVQRKYRLPEPVTFMQAADSTWSFQPYGHGLRPIFTRPGRRADGGLTLEKHLAKIQAGPRPVLYPLNPKFGPAPPSKLMRRNAARGYDDRDICISDNDGSVEPNGPRKRKRRYRRSVAVPDSDVEGDDESWSRGTKRRRSPSLSTEEDDIEDSNVIDPFTISSSRRLTRGLRAKISISGPQLKKLEPNVGREVNPGLNSLPRSFGLKTTASEPVTNPTVVSSTSDPDSSISTPMDIDAQGPDQLNKQAEEVALTQINHNQFPERALKNGSITLQGWWPGHKWLLENNMPVEFALQDSLAQQDILSADASLYTDELPRSFEASIESVAKWEQHSAKDFLLSSTQHASTRWLNHTSKSHEPSPVQDHTEMQWLDANAFTMETIPYAELEAAENETDGKKRKEVVEPPAKRQKRIYNRKSHDPNVVHPSRDTQKRYKNRHLTALAADLEGILDSPESAAATFGVQMVPNPPVPAPRQRGNHPDAALTEEVETRIVVAVVIMRTLIGGLEQQVDWVLIGKVFPEFSMNFLSKQWTKLSKGQSARIDKLGKEFQEPFLKAYEADEIPPIDYDNLADYDWHGLIDWTIQNVPLVVELKPQNLPTTRRELEHNYKLIDRGEPDKHYHYYSIFMPTYRRLEVVSMYHNTISIQPNPTVGMVDEHAVARSWIRAIQFTDESEWDVKYGEHKMNILGEDLAAAALEELRVNKVLIHKNKRRETPGRPYEATIGFSESFRNLLEEKQFVQAVQFKAFLDAQFQDPDGEGRRQGVPVNWLSDEGTVMCITNLQATGRIVLRAYNVPMNKFGLTDGGYETRKLEKSRLRFNLSIFPTPTYLFTAEIPQVHSLAQLAPPVAGDLDAIPVWCDIHQGVLEFMWRKVVTAIVAIVSMRSGIDLAQLSREMSPAMEQWEVVLFTDWAVRVGAIKEYDDEVGGWVTDDWWWLLVGIVDSAAVENPAG
ncbi:hypothetical protein PVAG01_00292 [Phlyctema vagabunda]|uniref:Transcription factor tau subunit sfc3/Tfc3 C-terminal domain-containing protein n=1 Tax=Phlyctema vagabunda TaxID=108571 RepID=A0ABR4PTU2_9HELO